MNTLGAVVSAGVDYLSMTIREDNPYLQSWFLACNQYLIDISGLGKEMVSSKRLGYEGYAVGGSFVGMRDTGAFATFSGERAKRAFDLLYRRDCHISRLDMQVSFQYTHTTDNVAKVALEQVIRDNKSISSSRQRNATIIEDLRGGATCYIGTRASEQFARIYNKEAESGDKQYERVWRFEVQLKNRFASKLAEQLSTKTYKSDEHALVFVKQWLRHRGVSTPWKAAGELLPLPQKLQEPSQLETKLEWLRTQVRPALRVLLKYGLRDAILEALGLDDNPPTGSV